VIHKYRLNGSSLAPVVRVFVKTLSQVWLDAKEQNAEVCREQNLDFLSLETDCSRCKAVVHLTCSIELFKIKLVLEERHRGISYWTLDTHIYVLKIDRF
jgi:hypothetical protein